MDAAQSSRLQNGVAAYNRGRYFECQQIFEDLHRDCEGGEAALVQSLTMISCGMHIHFHRGGGRGALNLFRQALIILDDLRPACCGVATGDLYDQLFAYVEELQGRSKPGARFFDRFLAPKIPSAG